MAFEKAVKYRTPDGVEHESAEAAKAHMRGAMYGLLGSATSADFEDPEPELRNAVREIYLLMWPRANAGKPRGPGKAKETPHNADDDGRAGDGRGKGETDRG